MRSLVFIATIAGLTLAAAPARASIGRPPVVPSATVKVVNQSDHAIEVSFNAGVLKAVEPGGSVSQVFPATFQSVTVHAQLLGSPAIGDTKKAALSAYKTTLVTAATNASATTLTLTPLQPGAVVQSVRREAGVALASTGGLLPLLWLGILLGRKRPLRQRLPLISA